MVGIILYGSFELAPYSKMYMRILDDLGIQYDLIGWKREEKTEYTGENVFIYEGPAAKRFSSPADKISFQLRSCRTSSSVVPASFGKKDEASFCVRLVKLYIRNTT